MFEVASVFKFAFLSFFQLFFSCPKLWLALFYKYTWYCHKSGLEMDHSNSKAFKLLSEIRAVATAAVAGFETVLPNNNLLWTFCGALSRWSKLWQWVKNTFCFMLPRGRQRTVSYPLLQPVHSMQPANIIVLFSAIHCAALYVFTEHWHLRGQSTEWAEESYSVHSFVSLMLFYFTTLLLSGKAWSCLITNRKKEN